MRRIVCSVKNGQSTVVLEGPPRPVQEYWGLKCSEIWATDEAPPALDDTVPAGPEPSAAPPGGTRWYIWEFPVMEKDHPGTALHQSDAVDYNFVISGKLELSLDDGTVQLLGPGDCIVNLGPNHAWRNPGPDPCMMSSVLIGANPGTAISRP